MTGKRCYFDDEEQELEYVITAELPGCTYCGHVGHDKLTCPVRPPEDFLRIKEGR